MKTMKKTAKLLLAFAVGCVVAACTQRMTASPDDVEINEKNFPDPNFRRYLLAQGYGADSLLTPDELKIITRMEIKNTNISDLTGIKHFTAMTILNCRRTQALKSIDVSGCTKLRYLECDGNELEALNVKGCTALQYINCARNRIVRLDLSTCTALRFLDCRTNQLVQLNISNTPALDALLCSHNQLTRLDASSHPALTTMDCSHNRITHLDIEDCPTLGLLYCAGNPLTGIDLTGCSSLTRIYCDPKLRKTLDTSGNPRLKFMEPDDRAITD